MSELSVVIDYFKKASREGWGHSSVTEALSWITAQGGEKGWEVVITPTSWVENLSPSPIAS